MLTTTKNVYSKGVIARGLVCSPVADTVGGRPTKDILNYLNLWLSFFFFRKYLCDF